MRTIAAWVTKSAMRKPDETIPALKRARINHASIMVNDFAGHRDPVAFSTHGFADIVRFAEACRDAGIAVSLTSWIMPHEEFIRCAAFELLELSDACSAEFVMWDAEEPWTQARDSMGHQAAAALIFDLMGGTTMALSGIVYANHAALGPLADICSIWSPQCYATTREGSPAPATIVSRGLEMWREKFGEPSRWIVGLAAYEQPPDSASMMRECTDDVTAHGLDAVCYWTSSAIERSASVREFVSTLLVEPSPSGIFPALDIDAMPSGVEVRAVRHVQLLLTSWGIDPGPIDGKPGAKTFEAVRRFQWSADLPGTGVVDQATWCALVRP